jgi:hypothetical protein
MRKEHFDFQEIAVPEDSGIGADSETEGFRPPYRFYRYFEGSLVIQYPVVGFFKTVDMDIESEVGVRLEKSQGITQQQSIGAELDMSAPLEYPLDQGKYRRIEKRLAAGYSDDRGRTFVYRLKALFQRHHLADGVAVLANPSAPGAGKIAEMSRFQHKDKRIFV